MIARTLVLVCMLMHGACGLAATPRDSANQARVDALRDADGEVLVVAHRGCWKDAPENSLRALEHCIELGVDVVEVDLRVLHDGTIVVFHDRTLARMTGDDRSIETLTLPEVRTLRLRNRDGRDGSTMTAERIPTFEEFLDRSDGRVLLDLDFKSEPRRLAPEVARILRARGACERTMFPLMAEADAARSLAPELFGCSHFIANLRVPMGIMSSVARSHAGLDPVAIAVRFDSWDYLEEGADDVADMGVRLWVNTLSPQHAAGLTHSDALADPDALWGRLVDAGVDMIQTDEPAALLAYLESTGRRASDR